MVAWLVSRLDSLELSYRSLHDNRCTQLAYSVYQLQPTLSVSRYGSYTAKMTAVFLPIIQCILLRTDALQHSLVGFYFVANIISAYNAPGVLYEQAELTPTSGFLSRRWRCSSTSHTG